KERFIIQRHLSQDRQVWHIRCVRFCNVQQAQQFYRAEGLRKDGIETLLKDIITFFCQHVRRQCDELDVLWIFRSQFPAKLHSIHRWHSNIQEDMGRVVVDGEGDTLMGIVEGDVFDAVLVEYE